MRLANGEDLVVFDRGGVIENKHVVHAAVVDSTGKLLFSAGDPSRLTLIRSAAKPAQSLAILEAGAFDKYAFDDVDLALMCASHNSEDDHIARAREMLRKIDAQESDLKCGGHPSISAEVNKRWNKADFEPTPVFNNCSGKHVGMLAGAQAIGTSTATYHIPTSPMQTRVKTVVEDLCRPTDKAALTWSIDGCNLPAPAMPLTSLATMYASFAAAADGVGDLKIEAARAKLMSRIFHAMSKHPEQVGGSGRFCTLLMQSFKQTLIGKVGADGCYGVGVRSSAQTERLGAAGSLGISVKIEDGNLDVLYAVVVEILARLRLLMPRERTAVQPFCQSQRYNTAGIVVGHISFPFSLKASSEL